MWQEHPTHALRGLIHTPQRSVLDDGPDPRRILVQMLRINMHCRQHHYHRGLGEASETTTGMEEIAEHEVHHEETRRSGIAIPIRLCTHRPPPYLLYLSCRQLRRRLGRRRWQRRCRLCCGLRRSGWYVLLVPCRSYRRLGRRAQVLRQILHSLQLGAGCRCRLSGDRLGHVVHVNRLELAHSFGVPQRCATSSSYSSHTPK